MLFFWGLRPRDGAWRIIGGTSADTNSRFRLAAGGQNPADARKVPFMNKFVNEAAQAGRRLPTAKNEDVEYSSELADADDLEAVERAEQADARQGRK